VPAVRRLALVGALVVVGTTAAAPPVTVLPRPRFNAPAGAPAHPRVTFTILSSTPIDPARLTPSPKPHGLRIEGPDPTTTHLVVAPGRYAFDFKNYAWPPRYVRADKEFVYEQVVWAKEANTGLLYVETSHDTYARSSYGLNGYLNAIDPKTKKLRWRSPALVANARNFVVLNTVIVSGYGFTDEPDYLYAVARSNGHVVGRVLLPTAADVITRHGNVLTVDTYDHRLTIRVVEH
jgi:hypothetical protein